MSIYYCKSWYLYQSIYISKKAPELTRRLHLFPAKSFSHPLRTQKYIFFHL